ncbi:MAG: V-type ATP synthase subunit E [Vicinamibacterales bacterium]|nr:V-type ATP synthase subunit E [Vicinamibacterales bacterium]
MSDLPGDATRVVGNDGIDETDTADPRVAALCDRVRRLAEAEGDESRQALERQAQEIVAAARSRTEAENTAALQGEEARLRKQAARELQNARLDARASLAAFRWSQLQAVLDETQQALEDLRARERRRYAAALIRLFHRACAELPRGPVVVRANVDDLQVLRDELETELVDTELVDYLEDDLPAGLVVSTADGNIVCDQTMDRRRSRRLGELQLAASETLFPGHRATGGGPDAR